MELFFEVQRQKTHILADAREGGTVNDVKKIISGVVQVPVSDITLKRPLTDAHTSWEALDPNKTLLDYGYTQKTAKPDEPALLAFMLPGDRNVSLTPVSVPPPLPDQMQQQDANAYMNVDA